MRVRVVTVDELRVNLANLPADHEVLLTTSDPDGRGWLRAVRVVDVHQGPARVVQLSDMRLSGDTIKAPA